MTEVQDDVLLEALRNDGRVELTAPPDDAGYARFEERARAIMALAQLGLMGYRTNHQFTFEHRGQHHVVANLSVEGRIEAERLASKRGRG